MVGHVPLHLKGKLINKGVASIYIPPCTKTPNFLRKNLNSIIFIMKMIKLGIDGLLLFTVCEKDINRID